ncbi:hypothetical protein AB0C52_11925 [Streptomyces sp. NPDC048717]|uniref:hypothetical protein n=1 Tax=Streptomyces sp. NPDC048717 TaxID=3154928 RepID=UPI0034393425
MSRVDDAVRRALAYLARQHETGYPDAVHTMGAYSTTKFVEQYATLLRLPPSYADRFSRFRCAGRTFHVALITDALQDAVDAGHVECRAPVEANAAYLRTVRDGLSWRYFPGFEPLPPDADTLGQVAQVLVRAGEAHPEDFTEAFALAAANAWENGAVNTFLWEDPARRRQTALNVLWGRGRDDTGRDPEVVANLMSGALLYERRVGPCALGPLIAAAGAWVAGQQEPMGFWRAAWYVGVYYSTYTAVRLLSTLGGYEESTARAARFLAQAPATDPLNRALTVLALRHCGQSPGRHEPGRDHDHDHGFDLDLDLELIVDSQFPDGSWEAIPLLDNHARVWGSRAVTTGFCLKALLAAS